MVKHDETGITLGEKLKFARKSAGLTQKEFYLVNQSDKQVFVIVTDEFIESRQRAEKIANKKFSIGNFSFVDCGIISDFGGMKNDN